ncbi:MAG: hypothetical protein GKR89_21605 [Candidatus Latescibacteria bacterium]|nr:hypothetical protein [Candidatus Latescibacterota bacterium]
MLSVKGTFKKGVAQPLEPVPAQEGQSVIITFLEESAPEPPSATDQTGWEMLDQLVENCAVDTGIKDLAHQHDHYLYGKPKQD